MNEKKNENTEIHDARMYVPDEIQRFELSENLSVVKPKTSNESKIKSYKSKLKSRTHLIAKLRKDLKEACWVVKTLASVNTRETTSLTNQVAYARSECLDLLERYNNNIDTIGTLHKQNVSLHDKLEKLSKFIHLGYEELKKVQGDRAQELSTLEQLKQLIESCGQYYADYSNEIKASQQIKQRNRFLKSKIIILENNIETIKEQLNALEYRYLRLKKENRQIKSNVETLNLKTELSEVQIMKNIDHESSTEKRCQDSGDALESLDFDLTAHLEIVKRLLSDQDTLLKDLTMISQEVSNDSCPK